MGRRYRNYALASGATAVAFMGVLGAPACTTSTGGNAKIDAVDAPAYRTSLSLSLSASAAASSIRENERQRSLAIQAVHTVCETLSTSSADAVDSVNAFVDAVKAGGDPAVTGGPAADALNHSADVVTSDMNDAVPQDVRDALVAWIDAARGAATVITAHAPPDRFNAAIGQLNDTRSTALNLCDASY
jgi:hypothetical protein